MQKYTEFLTTGQRALKLTLPVARWQHAQRMLHLLLLRLAAVLERLNDAVPQPAPAHAFHCTSEQQTWFQACMQSR